jgi:hypothetical protein
MAIDFPDVRRRVSHMRGPDISADDLGPAIDRAGRTLRDWRKSTEAALASLGDLSLDSLPQVSLDSLPGRRRPSRLRQNGPTVLVVLLGVLAGALIGWWVGSTARMGSGMAARTATWRSTGRSTEGPDAAPRTEPRPTDDGWSIRRQSTTDLPARNEAGREPGPPSDAWHGVGPGRESDPVGTPELVNRTTRTD